MSFPNLPGQVVVLGLKLPHAFQHQVGQLAVIHPLEPVLVGRHHVWKDFLHLLRDEPCALSGAEAILDRV